MTTPFANSLSSLEDQQLSSIRLLFFVVFTLFCLWLVWLFVFVMDVYEPSDHSRIELIQTKYVLQLERQGTVVYQGLKLGKAVKKGVSLLRLDTRTTELAKQKSQDIITAIDAQQQLLDREAVELIKEFTLREGQIKARALEHQARLRALTTELDVKQKELQRFQNLKNYTSQQSVDNLKADITIKMADIEALEQEFITDSYELKWAVLTLRKEQAQTKRQQAGLSERLQSNINAMKQYDIELTQLQILAPADGILADVMPLNIGEVTEEGQKFAVLLGDGSMTVVAHYPAESLGRIQTGQFAQVSLVSYPPTIYGYIKAEVRSISQEVDNGLVRVELDLLQTPQGIEISHGMTAKVRIKWAELTPFHLLMALLGQKLS